MRRPTKWDVEQAWRAWVATEMTYPDYDSKTPSEGLSPISAVRMIAHARFCCVFCDYVVRHELERIVEITRLDVMRAISARQRDIQEWLDDWQILPESPAKEHYRRHLADSQRSRIELICLRHLWLASQARKPSSVR
jgi:hypothetical protein